MENNQQTAVEWYNSKITKLEFWVETKQISWKEYHIGKDKLIEQAKAMEREQIINAVDAVKIVNRRYYKDGTDWKYWDDVLGWEVSTNEEYEYFGLSITGEKYYNQTYEVK